FGSTTWKRKKKSRGIEPDECFYIQNEPRVRGRLDIDIDRDPPPDLAIEVNLSRSSVDKLSVYAAIGINEVWTYDGKALLTYVLQNDGNYAGSQTSAALPFLRPADLQGFLDRFAEMDQNSLMRAVRSWSQGLK
ncbi:MAG: Uma2 family endonuclease, partial [Tepidisphaeraceae bacterium]